MNENNNASSKSLPAQVVVGLAVIGMGLLFLLDNLNIFPVRDIFHFWPMVFILVGGLKIYDSNDTGGRIFGGILVMIGVMLTLRSMGYIYFGWRTIWPVLIMLLGGVVVYNALRGRPTLQVGAIDAGRPIDAAPNDVDSVIELTAALGGIERRISSQDFRGGHVTSIMGGCELDLRQANIVSEAEIRVFAVMGGISMRVPPDWTVILRGTPIMAGFDEKTVSPPNSGKRLIISGYAIMAGVEIRN